MAQHKAIINQGWCSSTNVRQATTEAATMHGVKRATQKQSTEARTAKKAAEAKQLEVLKTLETRVWALRSTAREDQVLDRTRAQDTLEATAQLLAVNPETATAWNFRRQTIVEILLDTYMTQVGKQMPVVALAQMRLLQAALLDADLDLTEMALRAHPKVYWIWNHRRWCLQMYPSPQRLSADEAVVKGDSPVAVEKERPEPGAELDREMRQGGKWAREMKLVEHMLDLDPRNFHGWNYRRYVLAHLALAARAPPEAPLEAQVEGVPPQVKAALSLPPCPPPFPAQVPYSLLDKELGYTQRKIEQNFSNFSAWHQRQLVLRHRWALLEDVKEADLSLELNLLQQAMYTDPFDGSIWQHHRWIVEAKQRALPPHDTSVLDAEIQSLDELLELEPDAIRAFYPLVGCSADVSIVCKQNVVWLLGLRKRIRVASPDLNTADSDKQRRLLSELEQQDFLRKRRYQDQLAALG